MLGVWANPEEKPPVSILVRPSVLFGMRWESEKNPGVLLDWEGRQRSAQALTGQRGAVLMSWKEHDYGSQRAPIVKTKEPSSNKIVANKI